MISIQTPALAQHPPGGELLEVRRIWDQAPHNAFTDLIRFQDHWFCVFREAAVHQRDSTSAVRVLKSEDGSTWVPTARLVSPFHELPDIRDPKISETPDGRLMIVVAVDTLDGSEYHTAVSLSPDGQQWSELILVGEPNIWIWDVIWYRQTAYGIGYATRGRGARFTRLYNSTNGVTYTSLADTLIARANTNETRLAFLSDQRAVALIRRDPFETYRDTTSLLGLAEPPYTNWTWSELGLRLGGPNVLRLSDNRLIVGTRIYRTDHHTALFWLDPENGKYMEFLRLPSGGDTGYPGLVLHDEQLWVIYYSSHEDSASIYLARIRLLLPLIRISPDSIRFDTVAVGNTASATLAITNTGEADLDIREISTGHSHFVTHAGDLMIPPGSQHNVEILFIPPSQGTYAASLIIESDAHDSPVLAIPLIGTAVTSLGNTESLQVPSDFNLLQNFPNPFNPATTLRIELPMATEVTLTVHDILGREVSRLMEGWRDAGYYEVIWEGRKMDGRRLPSGVYFARLAAPGHTRSIKMALLN